MQGILSIVCPQMIYPYLRAIVSDVCTRAGFPPILLTEVNFQAMFEAQQAQAAGAGRQRLAHHHQRSTEAPAAGRITCPEPATARSSCSAPVPGARRWRSPRRRATTVLLWARDAAQAAEMARDALQPALPARGARCPRRCASPPSRDEALAFAARRAWPSSPRRWPALRERLPPAARRARRAVAVQGLRGRQRRAGPRDRPRDCGPTCPAACCRARASRSRSRAASPPRWWRPAPTRRCATLRSGLPRRQPAHLHQQPTPSASRSAAR